MKPINFITTLSPEKQYALRRWFFTSLVLSSVMLITLFCISIPRIISLVRIKNEITLLKQKIEQEHSLEKDYQELTTKHGILQGKKTKINNILNQHKNPHEHLVNILNACGKAITIEKIQFNKKSMELTILCPTTQHATILIKRLTALEAFANVKLTSLLQDTQTKQLRCIIKGTLN
jgi:Tfp pilus assembly protein PilN